MRRIFSNEHCQFPAYATGIVDGTEYPIGFKAVTTDLHSLGLRGNVKDMTPPETRIMAYEIGKWTDETAALVPADADWGGIWCGRTPGEAAKIERYFEETKRKDAIVLAVLMKEPIYAKPDRVKCAGVFPLGNAQETDLESLAKRFGIKLEF